MTISLASLYRAVPIVAAFVLIAAPAAALGGDVLRVPSQYATIQAAIDAASNGDTVLVADGYYTGPGNRDIDFLGKEIVVRSKNGAASTTIDAQGTRAVPYRVFVFQSNETSKSVIDGFTITGGDTLAGAVADPFNGGGVFIANASPTIRNCVFTGNDCACWGAAVYGGHGGTFTIENCLFVDNYAGDDGGGLFTWNGSSAVVSNSVFLRNGAAVTGGGIAQFGGGAITLVNVTMVENFAPFGGGIYSFGDLAIVNSILRGNTNAQIEGSGSTTTVTWSNVEGGYAGTGNVDVDARFQADGYHLKRRSPCRDAGDPAHVALPGEVDVDGQPRVLGGRVDMGADEVDGRVRPAGTSRHP